MQLFHCCRAMLQEDGSCAISGPKADSILKNMDAMGCDQEHSIVSCAHVLFCHQVKIKSIQPVPQTNL